MTGAITTKGSGTLITPLAFCNCKTYEYFLNFAFVICMQNMHLTAT